MNVYGLGKATRLACGITLTEISKSSGVAASELSKIERGIRTKPNLIGLKSLYEASGINLEEVFEEIASGSISCSPEQFNTLLLLKNLYDCLRKKFNNSKLLSEDDQYLLNLSKPKEIVPPDEFLSIIKENVIVPDQNIRCFYLPARYSLFLFDDNSKLIFMKIFLPKDNISAWLEHHIQYLKEDLLKFFIEQPLENLFTLPFDIHFMLNIIGAEGMNEEQKSSMKEVILNKMTYLAKNTIIVIEDTNTNNV